MKIGFDLDGVMYPFYDVVMYYMELYKHTPFLPYPTSWYFYKDQWDMTEEEWDQVFADGVNDEVIFYQGEPMFPAADVTEALRLAGHTIHIVTHRYHGDKSQYNTARWLKKNGIYYDSLSFSKDKTIIPLDFMVDDNLGNYKSCKKAGIRSYLMDATHNQHEVVEDRIFSINEYITEIDEANDGNNI